MKSTKHIVLLGDGMADEPTEELGGKTLLQYAETPNMDKIARGGVCGMVSTVPEGFKPGSDVANMSILGYDPADYYRGRAPIEAASMGIDLSPEDVSFRMNLVTLSDDGGRRRMVDYSSGHISNEEGEALVGYFKSEHGSFEFSFYPGKGYRHNMVWKNGRDGITTTPPHDITGEEIGTYLPHGSGAGRILKLMKDSQRELPDHPVNKERVSKGKAPANSVWFWGQGRKPVLPPFNKRFGFDPGTKGAVISAVDLVQGLGVLMSLSVIKVEGATGWIDTNYEGKVEAALDALSSGVDFVYLHVEAPDEAGHAGDLSLKIEAIEKFDKYIVGPILDGIVRHDRYRILLMPDHPTPIRIRTHNTDPVPFAMFGDGFSGRGVDGFSEVSCGKTGLFVDKGHTLLERLFG